MFQTLAGSYIFETIHGIIWIRDSELNSCVSAAPQIASLISGTLKDRNYRSFALCCASDAFEHCHYKSTFTLAHTLAKDSSAFFKKGGKKSSVPSCDSKITFWCLDLFHYGLP